MKKKKVSSLHVDVCFQSVYVRDLVYDRWFVSTPQRLSVPVLCTSVTIRVSHCRVSVFMYMHVPDAISILVC